MRRARTAVLAALSILAPALGPAAAETTSEAGAQRATRPRPPKSLPCDRNHLSSWQGEVGRYSRDDRKLIVQIRTDWETLEELALKYERPLDLRSQMLLLGEPFSESDWERIEATPGELQPHLRVTAWICRDDAGDLSAAILDWRPGDPTTSRQP